MPDRATASRLVLDAIREVNRTMDAGKELGDHESTPVTAEGTVLDSLGLVNLIVAIDAKVGDACGVETGLLDAMEVDVADSPLRTVGTLIDFIAQKI